MTSLAFIPFHWFVPLFKKEAADNLPVVTEQEVVLELGPNPHLSAPRERKAWEHADIGMARAVDRLQVRIAELIALRDETLRELEETQIRFDALAAARAQVELTRTEIGYE